jgi:hypothetical protein
MSSVCIKERWEGLICWITLSAGRYEILPAYWRKL